MRSARYGFCEVQNWMNDAHNNTLGHLQTAQSSPENPQQPCQAVCDISNFWNIVKNTKSKLGCSLIFTEPKMQSGQRACQQRI